MKDVTHSQMSQNSTVLYSTDIYMGDIQSSCCFDRGIFALVLFRDHFSVTCVIHVCVFSMPIKLVIVIGCIQRHSTTSGYMVLDVECELCVW